MVITGMTPTAPPTSLFSSAGATGGSDGLLGGNDYRVVETGAGFASPTDAFLAARS